ncbi:hypothetical protein BDZ94DRAFT_1229487 [Collybia nuda]|uniref:Uncharacterized protein n=1 Tax=Collybia nuda TaxID=64659 RepID=A0A9P6C8Q8_9AGAR|nr:hypothetical protein BDZ94DRAFT_1229487 [Collybia nuda]
MSSTHTTAKGTKDKAKQLYQKLFNADKAQIPVPLQANHDSIHDLAHSFSALSLPNSQDHTCNLDPEFVGGFSPSYATAPRPAILSSLDATYPLSHPPNQFAPLNIQASGKLQQSPSMPHPQVINNTPQSLTMQMALRLPQERDNRLSGDSPITRPTLMSKPPPSPYPSSQPRRPRVSSSPTASGSTIAAQQCAGITKAGNQCLRQVKSRLTPSNVDNSIDSAIIERFCFQHTKELLEPSGFYARKNGLWVDFDYWIPHYLQPDTQVALRVEMEKARSQSDVHGYIYTFEIRESHSTDTIKLKVGRAVNLVKRIDQWGKQCGSKEQILRGWYPGTVEPNKGGGSLMKGRVKAGEKGPWCHKLERLVHLELADLAATYAYLDPAWPKLPTTTKVPALNSVSVAGPCVDCGTNHKEIFELKKITSGHHKGKEWEVVIKPIIERWGLFVSTYV